MRSPGRPLDGEDRSFMESRLGHDFGQVRIHADPQAAEAARSVGARAFTLGRHIVFGQGAYRRDPAGRSLLAHELVHTVQQRGRIGVLQRAPEDEAEAAAPAQAPPDPVRALGQRLWSDFAAGVTVVFYDDGEPEIKRRAEDLASRENAIAATPVNFSASDLRFGLGFPESRFDVRRTIPRLGRELGVAADRAGKPAGVEPLPDTGPKQIRRLTVFAHGTEDWCSVGNELTTGRAPGLIKDVASHLTRDVNVVLYACSVARGTDEAESWRRGTMKPGGKGSLGASVRDALVEADKKEAQVWGHTTVGHTSRNWALRVFEAALGKGSTGVSFAGEKVFGVVEQIIAQMDVEEAIQEAGHQIPEDKKARVEAAMLSKIEDAFYDAYRAANQNETYQGVHLAEQAPIYPVQVATVIWDYWGIKFWPERRKKIAKELIKRYRLPKTPAPASQPTTPAQTPE